jgi:hypothetical protein
MSNGLMNRTREGFSLFSSGRERLRHPEGCLGDAIACEEMMEIIRWENEGGRLGSAKLDAGWGGCGETIATYLYGGNYQ